MYVLAYMLNQAYGITANQAWFDKHVKNVLDEKYPQDLSDGTYSYMKIPEIINQRITTGDWNHLDDSIIPYSDYLKMYEEIIKQMPAIDEEKEIKLSEKITTKQEAPNIDEH